ncbi:hypothetical protein SAMN05444920_101404 [Nonomuraea solani]|uniref:Uncharacterized protein n=1 Tax=Nonomuraea solani TaxID=1144553 RepID=A0A1H5U457_9ACTN|nr:hypothetical protein [Nonomuraea solani]SEF69829.1 hypothetical protein SAMN05444920_101404 [Nonomuraea solani]
MPDNPAAPDNDVGSGPAKRGRRGKVVVTVFTVVAALVGVPAGLLTIRAAVAGDDSPAIAIVAPAVGAGATASPCPAVRGTAKLAEGMALLVAVRRKTGWPRKRTTDFYRVDPARASGQWDVTVSLEADDPRMAGQWFSISALTVPAVWADFLEKVDGTADGPMMVASAMPPHEGEAPSIDVQREAGQGSC